MATMKGRRGRGRPTKELQQLIELERAQDRGKEIYGSSYVASMQYIADVASGATPSTPQLRLSAARVVKEQVEAWLNDAYKELPEDEEKEPEEDTSTPYLISIGS